MIVRLKRVRNRKHSKQESRCPALPDQQCTTPGVSKRSSGPYAAADLVAGTGSAFAS